MEIEVPRECWMSAKFLEGRYNVTDLSHFQVKKTHDGCVGDDGLRYMLPDGVSLKTIGPNIEDHIIAHNGDDPVTLPPRCPGCGGRVTGRQRSCSPRCRKRISRRQRNTY